MRVVVLGTGIMGAPIARNIASAGHDVVVWNRTPKKAENLGLPVSDPPLAEEASSFGPAPQQCRNPGLLLLGQARGLSRRFAFV